MKYYLVATVSGVVFISCQFLCRYLALKACFYKAQAFCYLGAELLASDRCGEAIKCMENSQKLYGETEEQCRLYGETAGPGTRAEPERHRFFKNLGAIIKRVAEKCQREIAMM